MLVLPDSDGLGVNLYQFSQRVKHAATDRHRPAQSDVKFRQFFARQFGCRVNTRARLIDDGVGDSEVVLANEISDKVLGFPTTRTVTDSYSLYSMSLNQFED
ncbi:MAG: hypothetical protein DDT38_00749 [Firmicutes bacterium]|nr:hypothetical protein [candidate division NPL-UPA2 bacterium]